MNDSPTLSSPSILFVCTGNYYRSRFAELYFNHLSKKEGRIWRADSRGFQPSGKNIGAISSFVPARLEKLKVEISLPQREPLKICEQDFRRYSRIIALDDREHRPMARKNFCSWKNKIQYWQVPDVPILTPDTALSIIESEVGKLLNSLSES